jgi:hypothetical protein
MSDAAHPWNGHHIAKGYGNNLFEGPLEPLPYPDRRPTVEEAVQAMHRDGCVIIPGVLNADEVQTLRQRMDAMGSQNEEDYVVPGWCFNKHVMSDFPHNADLLDYIDRPLVYEIVDAIHSGADGGQVQLVGGTSWITGAGRAMPIHIDWLPMHLPTAVWEDPTVTIPIFRSTLHIYLNDMTPELGPTTVIPGSHRAGRPPHDETSWNGILPQGVLVKAGDAMLFRWEIWHGSWKNTHPTDRRYMMQVHYGNGTLNKMYPSVKYSDLWSSEVLEKLTPRQRALVGGN